MRLFQLRTHVALATVLCFSRLWYFSRSLQSLSQWTRIRSKTVFTKESQYIWHNNWHYSTTRIPSNFWQIISFSPVCIILSNYDAILVFFLANRPVWAPCAYSGLYKSKLTTSVLLCDEACSFSAFAGSLFFDYRHLGQWYNYFEQSSF